MVADGKAKKPADDGELKFPYFLHCPKCKAKLKIAKPEMVGQRMPCPKCKARIDIVTPDEDGHVAYGVTPIDEKEMARKADEKFDEEQAERDELREKARKKAKRDGILWSVSLVFFMSVVVGVGYIWYRVMQDFNDPKNKEAREKRAEANANVSLISTQ